MHIRTLICALTVLGVACGGTSSEVASPLQPDSGASGDSWTVDAATDLGEQSDETDAPLADAFASADSLADAAKDNDIAADDAEAQQEPQDADIAGADDTAEPPVTLNGSTPQVPLVAPTFTALNADGQSRSFEDIAGAPTVMWFFPFAGSPG